MALQKQEQILCKALHTDLGKSKTESVMCEIGLVQGEIRWMKQHLGRLCRQKHVRTPLAQFAAKSYQSPSPYGNVLIMSPWNYPFLLSMDPVIGAVAAFGSAVVVYYNTAETVSVIDCIFESCSAFGTVGLSVGVTGQLNTGAKLLYMACMFMGRVGPVSLAMSLTAKPDDNKRKIMPVGHINVG